MNSGPVGFGDGAYRFGSPVDPGKVLWLIATTNGGLDQVRVAVQGRLYRGDLGDPGCARLRIEWLADSWGSLETDVSEVVCSGGVLPQSIPMSFDFTHPDLDRVRLVTQKAPLGGGNFTDVISATTAVS